ncbi:hypothetical protein, variant [Aphanomyces invadans]|nr:hypothetical protein, variant [Aphanomyces invadans]ETV92024.1 hypothetical protein, variant [Aphanomyces invadans]|eukprot:XP_008879321.1 hypothetical protein, variant [Aphanomyces invadans]
MSSPEKSSQQQGGYHRSTKSYSLRDRSSIRRQVTASAPQPNYPLYDDFGDARPPKRSKHHVDRQPSRKFYALSSSSSSDSTSDGEMQMIKRGSSRSKHGRRSSKGSSVLDTDKTKASLPADISPLDIDPSITWDSIGGLKSHIHALQEMVLLPLLYPEFYAKFALSPPAGVLFYGPPGTGKTLVARALANSTGSQRITFYMRKGADCLSKWVGEAERQLRVLFEQAKKTEPSIIFFDEIDGLAPVRSAKQDQIHASIVSTLLALMDGLDSRGRVVVIGATNRIDAIDPALRRPGRFDRELAFTLPNATDRAAMLGIHTKKWQPPLSTSFKEQLAKELVGYCGADIKALCSETALVAFKRSFPQVYDTPAKLDVDLTEMRVLRSDFQLAQAKIVPAAARSQTAVAAPLPPLLAPLLEEPLAKLVHLVHASFPTGLFAPPPAVTTNAAPIYDLATTTCSHCLNSLPNHGDNVSDRNIQSCELCRSSFHATCLASPTRCFSCMPSYTYIPPSLVRCLVFGTSGAMGQSVLTSALLSAMDGLPCVEFDRFSSPAQWMTKWSEVLTRVPCVVYFPHLDQSWNDHPTEIPALLHHWLQTAQHLPIVVVATASTVMLPADLVSLFPHQYEVTPPNEAARRSFWSAVGTWVSSPPPAALPPPKPLRVVAPPKAKEQTKSTASVLTDQEQHHLRELRIFLEAVVSYCIRQKANAPFVVIETMLDDGSTCRRHMDLTTIRDKVHDGEYTTWEKFMEHIHEIVQDAYAAYPKYSSMRYIAHAAANMQDNVMSFAHRFRKEQGYDLFATCREIQQAKLATRPVPAPMRLKRPGALPPSISPPPVAVDLVEDDAVSDEVQEVFAVGDPVFVAKRTGPGINKLGGAGRVQHVYNATDDGGLKYDVKFILGGFEKEVDAKYVRRLTEDTVQASVKMHATTTVVGANSRRAAAPTADDIFDATVWPHLYQAGWEYLPPPVGLWVADPPMDSEGTDHALSRAEWMERHQCFPSRDDVLAFVKQSPDYARLCFGQRYVERNIADGLVAKPVPWTPQEEMYFMMLEDKAASPTQAADRDGSTLSETPAFTVDEDQVRAIVEDLVQATNGWSVDALRQELVQLNHIVLAHRQHFDRRPMIEALRDRVQAFH